MTFAQDNHIDLILVQETWLRKCDGIILTEIKEFGYDLITFRKTVKLEWGGGVAVIFKNSLKVNHLKSSESYKTFEHVACKVITDTGPIVIISMYRRGYSVTNKFSVDDN